MSITANLANVASGLNTSGLIPGLNAELLNGQAGTYYSDASNTALYLAQSAFNAANNVFPQVQPAYDKANAAYSLATTNADTTNNFISYVSGVDSTQNTRLTGTEGNITYVLGALNQTNTNVVSSNTQLKAYVDGLISYVSGVRAWINCGYNGTMITRGSGNLSVSRSAVGVYNFTFTTAMPDANYCVTATAQTPVTNSDVACNLTYNVTPTVNGFSITTARYGDGNKDVTYLNVQVVR